MTSKSSLARQKILDASSAVFAEEGFAGARVDEIARRAGVNKAMLYYHIGNKQALYIEVLTRNFDRMEAALVDALARGGSIADRLQAIITGIAEALKANPDHPRIVLREFASEGTNLEPVVLERLVQIFGLVRSLLADGVRTEEFRATDPVMTHLTLIGASLILNATAPLRERVSEIESGVGMPDDDTDVGAFLADLLMHGIATPRSGEST